jgi:hypothetical protein
MAVYVDPEGESSVYEAGDYVNADCYIGLVQPAVPGPTQTRGYLLERGAGRARGCVRGERHDRQPGGAILLDDRNLPPLMTSQECEALRQVGEICVTFAVPPTKSGKQNKDS